MKRAFTIFVTFSLLLSFNSFGQIDEKKVEGNWYITSETYSDCEKATRNITHKGKDGCLESSHGIKTCVNTAFKANKIYESTIKSGDFDMIFKGTYEIKDNNMTVTTDEGKTVYKISFANDMLTLEDTLIGCKHVSTFKKK